jgi:hypothetical protein
LTTVFLSITAAFHARVERNVWIIQLPGAELDALQDKEPSSLIMVESKGPYTSTPIGARDPNFPRRTGISRVSKRGLTNGFLLGTSGQNITLAPGRDAVTCLKNGRGEESRVGSTPVTLSFAKGPQEQGSIPPCYISVRPRLTLWDLAISVAHGS